MIEQRGTVRLGSFDQPRLPAPPATPAVAVPAVQESSVSPAPAAPPVPEAQIDTSMVGREMKVGPADRQAETSAASPDNVVGGFLVRNLGNQLLVTAVESNPDAPRLPSYSTELVSGDRRVVVLVVADKTIPELAAPAALPADSESAGPAASEEVEGGT